MPIYDGDKQTLTSGYGTGLTTKQRNAINRQKEIFTDTQAIKDQGGDTRVSFTDTTPTKIEGGVTTGTNSGINNINGFIDDMHLSGLNPQWNLNFGGLLAGELAPVSTLNLLTSANTMHRLSLSLKGLAEQTAVPSAAQAALVFGGTGVTGADFTVAASAVTTATQKIVRLKGNYDDIAMSIPDLASQNNQTLMIFTNNVVTAGGVISFQMNIANEFDAESSELFVSGDGTTSYTRTALTDNHNQLILTDTGASTMLAGSFIYFHAGDDTDVMTVKACIRTTGGTIAITEGNND